MTRDKDRHGNLTHRCVEADSDYADLRSNRVRLSTPKEVAYGALFWLVVGGLAGTLLGSQCL